MSDCTHCTGSHYLADDTGLGPCVCCTPEALQRAEKALAARNKTIEALTAEKSLIGKLDELIESLTDVRDEVSALKNDAASASEETADVRAALRTYLSTQGHGDNPVTVAGMPDALAALVLAAGVV